MTVIAMYVLVSALFGLAWVAVFAVAKIRRTRRFRRSILTLLEAYGPLTLESILDAFEGVRACENCTQNVVSCLGVMSVKHLVRMTRTTSSLSEFSVTPSGREHLRMIERASGRLLERDILISHHVLHGAPGT